MNRPLSFSVAACLVLALAAGCLWRYLVGPSRMVAAIERGDVQRIVLFNSHGIRANSDAFLVGGFMHCATASGQTLAMARLHDLGANVNRLDGYGVTPLHVAVHSRRMDSLLWLMAHGADPSIRDRDGRTVADYVSADIPQQQRQDFVSALEQTSNKHLQETPR